MNYISSQQNAVYKFVKSLTVKKNRVKAHQYTIEGLKFVKTAVESGQRCHLLIVKESVEVDYNGFDAYDQHYVFSEALFNQLNVTEHSQGVLGVLEIPEAFDMLCETERLKQMDRILILDRIQDPGNLGTIVRTVDAVDYSLLLMNKGCVDLFNEKVVRSSAGSISSIQYAIVDSLVETVAILKASGFRILVTALRDAVDYSNTHLYHGKCAIIIGNEANGVSDDLIHLADHVVKIPIIGRAESLNAAVAAGVILYKSIETSAK